MGRARHARHRTLLMSQVSRSVAIVLAIAQCITEAEIGLFLVDKEREADTNNDRVRNGTPSSPTKW